MPVMSGMEFLRLLRQRGHSDQPKVVFCTTENDMAHIRAALEAGAPGYVMKTVDPATPSIKLQLVRLASTPEKERAVARSPDPRPPPCPARRRTPLTIAAA